jgi:hypothetical protein
MISWAKLGKFGESPALMSLQAPQISHDINLRLNPRFHSEKGAPNQFSYGMAIHFKLIGS